MNAEQVAVIVVNYNAGDYLRRCLDALAQQTVLPGRVIVVDNNSDDHSADNLSSDIPLTVLRQSQNLGFAAANNLAATQCTDSEWIVLLNPDAFARPNWLEELLRGAARHPQYRVFASRQMMIDVSESAADAQLDAKVDGAGDVYHTSGLAWRRGHNREMGAAYQQDETVFGPCAAAAMYRRDVFQELGGFDESYFCYFEDVDLAFRLQLAGHGCMYLSNAVVDHVGSATTSVRSDFSVYHGHRNLVWTYIKNMPRSLLWRTVFMHVSMNLVSLGAFSWRGQAGPIWRAKWDAMRQLPRVLRQRRELQRHYRRNLSSTSTERTIPTPKTLHQMMRRGITGLARH